MQTSRVSSISRKILGLLVFSLLVLSQTNLVAGRAEAHLAAPPVEIRWFVGLGTGDTPDQVAVEQQVVNDFNASHPNIHLTLEVQSSAVASNILRAEIANGNAPDLVGPVGWVGSQNFHGQYLDLAPLISSTGFDTSIFDPALLSQYITDEGTIGLPFAVYPSAIFYNPALFTAAGLNPPPADYVTHQYEMPDHSLVDWDWDTLKQVAKLLTLDSAGKHSGEAGFDATNIVQYGFTFQWEGHPNYWGAYWKSGSLLQGSAGSYSADIPAEWEAAWEWVYEGMWDDEPFIPTGPVEGSPDFNSGNSFASGKIAMAEMPSWYLCCTSDLVNGGGTFQFGAMPSYNAAVAGRVDADTFRVLKATTHPEEAFTVLAYLVTTGVDKLIVGTPGQPPAYGAISAIPSKQAPWLAEKKTQFPFVTQASWDVLLDGLDYPDVPSAESYMPNMIESWNRVQDTGNVLKNNKGLDLASEEATLESDLTSIFNTSYVLISGNAGASDVTLNYFDGSNKTATSIFDGSYALTVSSGWSGTITPSRAGYAFSPPYRTYTYVTADQAAQDYAALPQLYLPLVIR